MSIIRIRRNGFTFTVEFGADQDYAEVMDQFEQDGWSCEIIA